MMNQAICSINLVVLRGNSELAVLVYPTIVEVTMVEITMSIYGVLVK